MLGQLLIEGIQSHKAYVNFADYDITATNPAKGKMCRIQVRSRYATNATSFNFDKDLDCDFVVVVFLNLGHCWPDKPGGRRPPKTYVFPIDVARAAHMNKRGMIGKSKIDNIDQYLDNWDTVKRFLGIEPDELVESPAVSATRRPVTRRPADP